MVIIIWWLWFLLPNNSNKNHNHNNHHNLNYKTVAPIEKPLSRSCAAVLPGLEAMWEIQLVLTTWRWNCVRHVRAGWESQRWKRNHDLQKKWWSHYDSINCWKSLYNYINQQSSIIIKLLEIITFIINHSDDEPSNAQNYHSMYLNRGWQMPLFGDFGHHLHLYFLEIVSPMVEWCLQ